MSMHPYGKDVIPAKSSKGRGVHPQYRAMPQPHTVQISDWTSWEAPDPAYWVPRGYIVVNADCRGGGTSEGMYELLSDLEAQDYYDLVEWAGAQPWSNGRVALDGMSYLAINQYKVAALQPPSLAAICPWEGFTDFYRDFARPGGVREDGFTILWGSMLEKAAKCATDLRNVMMIRETRDAWYEAMTPCLERITAPILVCGSFSDQSVHNRGSFEAYRRAGSAYKWLYTHRDGKWAHYYSPVATAVRERFFEQFLKGTGGNVVTEPSVRIAVYERGPEPVAVHYENSWPPKDLIWTTLALDLINGALAANWETIKRRPSSSSSAKAPTLPIPGAVSFNILRDTAKLVWVVPEDMDIIGPMALRLHVQLPESTDANLFVGVRKYHDGAECLFEGSFGFSRDIVSKGWQRVAFRELDQELSIPELPVHTFRRIQPVGPDEIVPVDIELRPHATRFRAGDRLQLDIKGRWHFPRDPLRGQMLAGYETGPEGRCVLHTGGAYDSHLLFGWRPIGASNGLATNGTTQGV
jgi:hypothetical protein